MTHPPLYPLRFEPILKRLIWGGRRLETLLGKPLGEGHDYAESWEVADHRQGRSVVADGPLAGRTLGELVRERTAEMLGPALISHQQFPLLVKFLDAHDVLSVQVHPGDEVGRRLVDDNGKTEAWVILHAAPGSLIYAGLRPGVTAQTFGDALVAGEVEPLLHRFPAVEGDCIMIPAGTVHAIGAGVVLAEIQQMSDATFRVHDWGRLGPDGSPRALHLAEALEATDFDAGPVSPMRVEGAPGSVEHLARCPYFAIDRLNLTAGTMVGTPERFTLLVGLGGEAAVGPERLGPGQTLLLPASVGPVEVVPRGRATILAVVVP